MIEERGRKLVVSVKRRYEGEPDWNVVNNFTPDTEPRTPKEPNGEAKGWLEKHTLSELKSWTRGKLLVRVGGYAISGASSDRDPSRKKELTRKPQHSGDDSYPTDLSFRPVGSNGRFETTTFGPAQESNVGAALVAAMRSKVFGVR